MLILVHRSGIQRCTQSRAFPIWDFDKCVRRLAVVRVVLCSNLSAASECDIDFIAHLVKTGAF